MVSLLEHSNSQFESSRFVMRIDSFCKKSAFRCTSCHTPQCTQLKAIPCRTSTKNSYVMHTIKITPNLLFEYQCTSGKFIRLPNRINRIGSENRIERFFAQLGML